MTPWDVLTRLYECELNGGLQADWDGGIIAWIGGPAYADLSAMWDEDVTDSRLPPGLSTILTPILAKKAFSSEEFDRVAEWMDREARRLFPQNYRPIQN
jgi:hypothetical protein